MTQHLREDEYSSILSGATRQEWLRHMKECPQCEQRLQQEQRRIEQLRTLLQAAGTRPENYWEAQHARITARLQQPRPKGMQPVWKLAMAGALTLILAGFSFSLLRSPHVSHPQGPNASPALTDAQLMQEMEEVANSEVPAAMEPANVLVQDMEYHANSETENRRLRKAGSQ